MSLRSSDVRKIAKVEDFVSNNPHISFKYLTKETGISREEFPTFLYSCS